MDTDSFIFHTKTETFYKDNPDDVKKWFDRSNYEVDRLLPRGLNKKVNGFKDKLGGKIMKELVALRPKGYSHLMDDGSEHKRAKRIKKSIIKREIKSKNDKDSLFKTKIMLKSQQRFKSDCYCVYTEEINNIALSSNDDKRLQTFLKITTCPYETNIFKVCGKEVLSKCIWLILMII